MHWHFHPAVFTSTWVLCLSVSSVCVCAHAFIRVCVCVRERERECVHVHVLVNAVVFELLLCWLSLTFLIVQCNSMGCNWLFCFFVFGLFVITLSGAFAIWQTITSLCIVSTSILLYWPAWATRAFCSFVQWVNHRQWKLVLCLIPVMKAVGFCHIIMKMKKMKLRGCVWGWGT